MLAYKIITFKYKNFGSFSYSSNLREPCSQLRHAILSYNKMDQRLKRDQINPESLFGISMKYAALLHDIGHLKKALDDPKVKDDKHEIVGSVILKNLGFPTLLTECVRLHVDVKRMRATQCENYRESLSEGSKLSLLKQGFPMPKSEMQELEKSLYIAPAFVLRECDDDGKDDIVLSEENEFQEFCKLLSIPHLELLINSDKCTKLDFVDRP